MLIEAAQRAQAAAKEMVALLNEGAASCSELRQMLELSKSTVAIMSAAQVRAAASIAGRERHGDGGAEVLASGAGLSRREAHSQVKVAKVLREVPAARHAVESGRVSPVNAKRLAEAVERTGADAGVVVGGLLAGAASMRPEQFAREARRWVADQQDDGGESEFRRQRERRFVRVWDTDDGMIALRGEFDAVTGRRIGNRLRAAAGRMYSADKKTAAASTSDSVSSRRSFDQCMADALDSLTAHNAATGSVSDNGNDGRGNGGGGNGNDGRGRPFADICVVAHVDDSTGELVAELPDGARLPQAVLEELACNAKLTGVVYDRKGKPIWRAESCRGATEAQRQILLARHGGCFHCAAHPALCQIHHIRPVSQGGPTRIDNMVPICWDCHHKIHHHQWQIHTTAGVHTLHPPQPTCHGPAHAPEHPPLHLPGTDPPSDAVPRLPGTDLPSERPVPRRV